LSAAPDTIVLIHGLYLERFEGIQAMPGPA
jgi:hypothetical protein